MRSWGVIGLAIIATAGPARAEDYPYALTIGARLQVKSPGQIKAQPLETSTVMRYTITPVEGGEEVTLRGLALTVASEGKTISDVSLSRKEASFKQGDQRADTLSFERAPRELKATLEQFGKPMARYTRAAAGAETKRELMVEETSSFVENGIVDNTRLFHPPFPADRDEWQAPARISMGEGQFAAGTLTYRKAGPGPDGTVRVEVGGGLKPQVRQGGDVRDGAYTVRGEQLYDPARAAWASGKLAIDVTLDLQAEGQPTGTATGTMDVTLAADSDTATPTVAPAAPEPEPEPAASEATDPPATP